MSSIDSVFSRPGHKALIPYITVGYPNIETTLRAVKVLTRCHADIIELGIPFSDPLADGATIQRASYNALVNGVTPEICLEVAREIRKESNIPLVFMTYLNPVFQYGFNKFCTACASSAINGLIIPDQPPEESDALDKEASGNNLDIIYLLAPTSDDERIKLVVNRSRGFVYLVSVTGVTGARNNLSHNLKPFLDRVREQTAKPLCVGFGISTPVQAKEVAQIADGVIVGSRIIQLIEEDESLSSLEQFAQELRAAIDG